MTNLPLVKKSENGTYIALKGFRQIKALLAKRSFIYVFDAEHNEKLRVKIYKNKVLMKVEIFVEDAQVNIPDFLPQ